MARNKRVFPFFLDGGVQEVTAPSGSGTVAWNGTSSFVYVTGTQDGGTLTLGTTDSYGRPLPHGVMVTVFVDGSGRITVDTTSAEMQDLNADVILGSPGETATFLFKSPTATNDKGEWVLIALNQRLTNVYDIVSFNSSAVFNSTARFNDRVYRRFGNADLNDAATATAAQVLDGFITYTPTANPNNIITLPTAAQFVAAGLNTAQDSVMLHIYNDSPTVQATLQFGSGGTLSGSGNIVAGQAGTFLIRMTDVGSGTEAYMCHRI